jgi:hypothetical protein
VDPTAAAVGCAVCTSCLQYAAAVTQLLGAEGQALVCIVVVKVAATAAAAAEVVEAAIACHSMAVSAWALALAGSRSA